MRGIKYTLGLDLGTNSIGWACVDHDNKKIIDAGVRIFNAAENPKTGESLALPRRISRLTRRRLHRRWQRLQNISKLLIKYHFIKDKTQIQSPYQQNIWNLRVRSLDHPLSNEEISRIIYHISKNRGFKSSKKELNNPKNTELTKANKDMESLQENFKNSISRTISEYMINTYGKQHKNIRNKLGSYSQLIKQDLHFDELKLILQQQKKFGNTLITDLFIQELFEILSYRKGLPSFEDKVGKCELEIEYNRAPKDAISSSLLRAWQDLNHLIYYTDENTNKQSISLENRKLLIEKSFSQKTISDSTIGKLLNIEWKEYLDKKGSSKKEYNTNIPLEKIAKSLTFKSYHELQKELSNLGLWEKVKNDYSTLDAIIYCIAYLKEFNNFKKNNLYLVQDPTIKEIITSLNWNDTIWETLFDSLTFDGTMKHSLQAIWTLLPYFQMNTEEHKPITYDKAVNYAYPGKFNNRESLNKKFVPEFPEHNITNPVVKRTLNQTRLLINKLISLYGKPEQINIELARNLGKSKSERIDIEKYYKENQARNEEFKKESERIGIDPIMYRLWKEQKMICMYTGKTISQEDLKNNRVEIDHILPISRSGDDSISNKVLVFANENQSKGNQTAFEFLSSKGQQELENYKIRILYSKLNKKKKERLLLDQFDDIKSQEYKTRHLNDSRYIATALKNHLDKTIRPENQHYGYIQTLSGQATSVVRRMWSMGVKDRDEHTHHALDALIIAGLGTNIKKSELYITRSSHNIEHNQDWCENTKRNILKRGFDIPEPWENFNKDSRYYVMNNIFVSRMGKRKINGSMHGETIMSKRKNGDVVKTILLSSLGKSTESEVIKKIEHIIDRNNRNSFLYDIIIEHARKFNWNMSEAFNDKNAPSMPNKKADKAIHIPKIRKVKIIASASSTLFLKNMSSENRQAATDSGDIIRLDLFKNTNNKYEVVPIYPFHYKELPEPSDPKSEFCFSIYKNDYLSFESDKEFSNTSEDESKRKKVKYIEGYYNTRGGGGKIKIMPHDSNNLFVISFSSMKAIKKYHIDILGKKHLINIPEKRLSLQEVAQKWERDKK